MSLILDVIVGLLRLFAACRHSTSRLRVVPARDMLEVTFGSLVSSQAYARVASIFDLDAQLDEQAMLSTLGPFIQAVEKSLLHDPTAREHLERARRAVQELCTVSSMVQSEYFTDLHVQFSSALVFRYMQYFYLCPPSEQPVTVLVGAVPQGESLLALPPAGSHALHQVQFAYAVADPYPRLSTDYWLRFPPNPNKQRLPGWSAFDVGAHRNIELYRLKIPGERPVLSLASEAVTFPLDITVPGARVSIDPNVATVTGIRTTVRDKIQSWLLVAVRVFDKAGG